MKFGKLADISQVDFTLPPDPAENLRFLQKFKPRATTPEILIGCTGWRMKEWVGKVYPPNTKAKDYLYHYSRQFNTIELNTTHYRIPNLQTIQNWYNQSAADFRFCPKIPQSISHHRQLGVGTGYIEAFCDAVIGLKEKLGVCFMQLPPYFGPERIPLLEVFLEQWPAEIPLALEFRQESWFTEKEMVERFFKKLEDKKISLVITDVAGRRDVLHMRLTSTVALIRLVGNGLVPSDYQRVDEWIARWQDWLARGVQQIYCFAHEPDNLLAPELGDYIHQQVAQLEQVISRGPTFYQDPADSQISLF